MWTDEHEPGPHGGVAPSRDQSSRADREARRRARAQRLAAQRRRRLTVTVTAAAVLAAGGFVMLRPATDVAPQVAGPASLAQTTTALSERITEEVSPSEATDLAPRDEPASASPASDASGPTTQKAVSPAKAESKQPESEPAASSKDLPVLSEGDYGDVIAVAQRALDVEPTGYFGPKTRKAVAEHQEAVGLPATGQIATFTWATLGDRTVQEATEASSLPEGFVDGEPAQIQETPAEEPQQEPAASTARTAKTNAEPPVLEETDSGEAVAVIQRALGVKPASGYFGPLTAKAVRGFQADNGIPTTGVIASYTWSALGADLRSDAAAAHAAYGTVFGPGVKDGGKNSGGGSSSSSGGGSSSSGGAGGNGKGLFCPVKNFYYGDGLGAARPGGRSHAGLDLMGSRGEPIYAIDSGTVTRSGYQSNGAMILDITGSRGMYFYGHFDKILVGYGESVKAGQLIGYMGDTGSPGAVHLHLEVRPNGWSGGYDDPVPLIKSLC